MGFERIEFAPAAPVLDVIVRVPRGSEAVTMPGRLDSGANVCGVPDTLIERLDITPVRVTRAAGFAGDLREVIVYRIDIELAQTSVERVEAIATRRPYVIVGRNVLKQFVLRLDGPKDELALRTPVSRRRRKR